MIRPPENEQETRRFYQELCRIVNNIPTVPADSTAANIGEMVTDFNALLAVLRTAFK